MLGAGHDKPPPAPRGLDITRESLEARLTDNPTALPWPRLGRRAEAALAISLACVLSTAQDTAIKWISGAYPFHEMQTIRCGASLILVGAFTAATGGMGSLAMPQWPLVIARGLLLALASALFYLTAAAMPYPEAVALYFTMPLLVAALSGPLLGQRVPPIRWAAVAAGLVGVLVILRPGAAAFEPAAFLGLGCALLYALGNLMTRPLSGALAPAPLAFWQNAMYLAVALALSAVFGAGERHVASHLSLDYLTRGWLWPTLPDFLLIGGLGVSTAILFGLFTLGYRRAEASFVAPFEYSAMVWAVLFSFAVWGQWPDLFAAVGIGLIVGAGLVLAARDR